MNHQLTLPKPLLNTCAVLVITLAGLSCAEAAQYSVPTLGTSGQVQLDNVTITGDGSANDSSTGTLLKALDNHPLHTGQVFQLEKTFAATGSEDATFNTVGGKVNIPALVESALVSHSLQLSRTNTAPLQFTVTKLNSSAFTPPKQYVGTIEGSNAYIAVVDAGDGWASVYICDGKQATVWVEGKLKAGAFEAASADAPNLKINGRFDGNVVTGTGTLADGSTYKFRAERSSLPAGLYQINTVEGLEAVSAATIVLPDGSARGQKLRCDRLDHRGRRRCRGGSPDDLLPLLLL